MVLSIAASAQSFILFFFKKIIYLFLFGCVNYLHKGCSGSSLVVGVSRGCSAMQEVCRLLTTVASPGAQGARAWISQQLWFLGLRAQEAEELGHVDSVVHDMAYGSS